VKVDYDLVQKDPKITEQLKEIVEFKEKKGKQVLNEGRKEQLISERTFHQNLKRLERWVSSSHRKIQELSANLVLVPSTRPKLKVQTNDQLVAESVEGRERLAKLMTHNIEAESSVAQPHESELEGTGSSRERVGTQLLHGERAAKATDFRHPLVWPPGCSGSRGTRRSRVRAL
jgi:hypothetical protein